MEDIYIYIYIYKDMAIGRVIDIDLDMSVYGTETWMLIHSSSYQHMSLAVSAIMLTDLLYTFWQDNSVRAQVSQLLPLHH